MTLQIRMYFLSFFLAISTLMSCDIDDDNSETNNTNNNNISKTEASATVQNGSWRITNFVDSGDDETHHFNGYAFTFEASGVLTATNGTNEYTGTWSIVDSNSSDDDDSEDGVELIINFDLTNSFEELNEDWHFISRTANKIELIHVSGGNGGTDYLTFEKN